MRRSLIVIILALLFLLNACTTKPVRTEHDISKMDRATRVAYIRVDQYLEFGASSQSPVEISKHSKIDSIVVNKAKKQLDVYLDDWFASMPFRISNTAAIYKGMRKSLGRKFKRYSLKIYGGEVAIEQLIPNYYRGNQKAYDRSRMPKTDAVGTALVRNVSKDWTPTKGLYNRHIALWSSHGWYYENKLDRWEWQRARVFQSVEDLLPHAFVTRYLMPMLENSGAHVLLPRERDVQANESVIDNDTPKNSQEYQESKSREASSQPGFAVGTPPYTDGVNPFELGTFRHLESNAQATSSVKWIPNIADDGEYAVYISYSASDENVSDAHYSVYHLGGKTDFLVNQQMGGSTWIYLGTFMFNAGSQAESGRVELTNQSAEPGKTVTADAVRFGGGMGNIARNGQTSRRPRFVEGARYYLQYAGMPDTLVYRLNEDSDYKDDYQSRGEWVNYLKGAPFGPNKDRTVEGLKIPIDLALAFHTDAGTTRNDTVIGTLMIYRDEDENGSTLFPDEMSRLASRDLGDIMQTQIVEDIRAKYDPAWTRRWIWNRGYSEAYRPNVPSALLELLSHQNFLDMKFAMDPDFRFHTSRSIYKAMLKFISTQYQVDYVVQPLPVSHFQATFGKSGEAVLKWKPTVDPLEATATPDKYVVYTRVGDKDFGNGKLVSQPEMMVSDLKPGEIYSFKVTAVNDGGESFPSEILAVSYLENDKKPVLIVNGFDRISAAGTIETDEYLGFMNLWDQGVPDRYDQDYIGQQYDLLASSPWLDDDEPGHGASFADYETTIIPGNTFDFPYLHGTSIKASGYSFISSSDEAIMDNQLDMTEYAYIDLILGEEKATDGPKPRVEKRFRAFPKPLQAALEHYVSMGGNLFISGAYVGTDLFENRVDSLDMDFAEQVLRYRHRTDHAVHTGGVVSSDTLLFAVPDGLEFNTLVHPKLYAVEAPDAIEPADTNTVTVLRYAENNTSAAVAHQGDSNIIIFGFPFETIISQEHRDEVMKSVMDFFLRKE